MYLSKTMMFNLFHCHFKNSNSFKIRKILVMMKKIGGIFFLEKTFRVHLHESKVIELVSENQIKAPQYDKIRNI